jgi:hypothetical protein
MYFLALILLDWKKNVVAYCIMEIQCVRSKKQLIEQTDVTETVRSGGQYATLRGSYINMQNEYCLLKTVHHSCA